MKNKVHNLVDEAGTRNQHILNNLSSKFGTTNVTDCFPLVNWLLFGQSQRIVKNKSILSHHFHLTYIYDKRTISSFAFNID